jgi:hypothetical protein
MAIKTFQAVDMSTIYDVCLNTYGNLDLLVKLMVDNNFEGVNSYPVAGQLFTYDDTLVYGLASQKNNVIKYATGE